jgi:tripartite-type tricarboxylate transporter receptor subunit TctC
MTIKRLAALLVGAAMALSLPVLAQDATDRPGRIIVPFPPGAATDTLGRMLASQFAERLGQKFIVENKPGANAIIATAYVAKAAPDGSTLLLTGSNHASNVAVYQRLPFDTAKDFAAVGLIGATPSLIAVNPKVPAKNLAELLALARSEPGRVTYGTAGHGSPPHLAGELLAARSGTKLMHVPYKGGAPAMADTIGGHIPMLIGGLPTIAPNVRGGKLRAIAVTTGKRSPVMPDTPTIAESGFPGFDSGIWYTLLAPAHTPHETVQRLNKALNEALADPAFREQLERIGIEPLGGSAKEMDERITREIRLWSELVQRSGIKRVE